jgi:hypothetical protein
MHERRPRGTGVCGVRHTMGIPGRALVHTSHSPSPQLGSRAVDNAGKEIAVGVARLSEGVPATVE